MPCIPFHTADGKVSGIVCTRGRRGKPKPCATCRAPAGLECDGTGCDKPLCAGCAVSPREGLDFCPACCLDVFRHWRDRLGGAAAYQLGNTDAARRSNGRNAFRAWAKANAERFIEFVRGRRLDPGEIIWAPLRLATPAADSSDVAFEATVSTPSRASAQPAAELEPPRGRSSSEG